MKLSLLRECVRISVEKTKPDLHPQFNYYPHYSFIIQRNQLVEWGENVSAPAMIKFGYPTWSKQHSETIAFRRAKGIMDLGRPFEVINIRLNRLHESRNSCPCIPCQNFLAILGCSAVYYSTNIGFDRLQLQKSNEYSPRR